MVQDGGEDGKNEVNGPKSQGDLGTQDGPVSMRQIEEPIKEDEPEEWNAFVINPFLMPPVLRYVLKFVKTPDLKGLRSISSLWDTVVLEEMEIRAWKGQYPQLGFDWNHYWKTINTDPLKSFKNFFNSTMTCPNLYRSFNFDFPGAPLVLSQPKYILFFDIYSPRLVELALPTNFNFTEDANARNLLRGFVHQMAPTLIELTISKTVTISDLPPIPAQVSVERIVFPKLEKLSISHSRSNRRNHFDRSVTSAFTTLFGQGICEMPNLKELEISSAFGSLDDLFGIQMMDPIRWRSLTSLQIIVDWTMYYDNEGINKFVDGLMFLDRSGMALENFILAFKGEISHQVSGNLSLFLQNQSKFLKNLSLNLSIHARVNDNEELNVEILPKIQLPLCPCLKSLDIYSMYYRHLDQITEYFELFGLISLPNNFPSLETLSLSSPCATTMALLRKTIDPAGRRHLEVFEYKSLNWRNSEWTEEHNANLLNNYPSIGLIKIN